MGTTEMEDASVARHRNFVFVLGEMSSAHWKGQARSEAGVQLFQKAGSKPCLVDFRRQCGRRHRRANLGHDLAMTGSCGRGLERCDLLVKCLTTRGKKCYNFQLALKLASTACCRSARTAPLVIVVGLLAAVSRNSQLIGWAVHYYSRLFPTFTAARRHDPTQTRNSTFLA